MGSIPASPLAMIPGSDNELVYCPRTLLFDGFINIPCPETILGIKKASHFEHGRFYVTESGSCIVGFPPVIIIWMLDDLIPCMNAVFFCNFCKIADRAHRQIKV